ncbi:MAG: bifunctional phosphopantothenoylcysteine decarboxylase/phosphopantothenate--cysteine ligase CoaBC [Sulfurospirillum sp.]|nr:MAG: bifunctional phosphopantothenoylcysteine decarboxylase/phosphopantothenate--cysteine ligase CoaBC [Sulfurospirillum sp.]
MQNLLEGKNIVIGVSGSISIYKSLELIRLFIKSGAKVRVVMSESAKEFITPLTFESLTRKKVLHKESESWADDNNHIDLGKWADLVVIAPATANTINKISNGIADNLLLSLVLAYKKQKIIAPAANTNMYKNPLTQTSLKMLKLTNFDIVNPQNKMLACGDVGDGALAEVEDIFYASAKALLKDEYWSNRRVVVSGGGTIERIDDVRYISNFSSGKMASSLSLALYLKGADVCLIGSKISDKLPSDLYTIKVESSKELKEYLVDAIRVAKKGVLTKATLMDDSVPELIQKKPYLFMAAAVSDYVPKYPQSGKLKKSSIGEEWNLELVKNEDILGSLDKSEVYSVGFKAETDSQKGLENAKRMLKEKNLDAVCFNDVSKNSFGSDENEIVLLTKDKKIDLPKSDKLSLSLNLLDKIKILGD